LSDEQIIDLIRAWSGGHWFRAVDLLEDDAPPLNVETSNNAQLGRWLGMLKDRTRALEQKKDGSGRRFWRVIPDQAEQDARRVRAQTDWSEHTEADRPGALLDTAPGYHVRGVSTLRDRNGRVVLAWEKTARDKDSQLQALLAAVATIGDKLPREPLVALGTVNADLDDDLLCVYPLGDPHFGLYSWAQETGQDFDLKIAERGLVSAADRLVMLAPPARRALILNLGDFFHSDNQQNRTSRAGNALDVDSRWARVLQVGIRAMTRVVDRALEKHADVIIRCEIGNHDDHTSIVLATVLAHHYDVNPRVTVDTSPTQFWRYRFGRCLLATTHGHTCKLVKLPGIMATDWPEDWGATEHRRWYVGHFHHERVQEHPGCTVEVFRTTAARDAWHAAAGYRSGRDLRLHVWHSKRGLISTTRTEPIL